MYRKHTLNKLIITRIMILIPVIPCICINRPNLDSNFICPNNYPHASLTSAQVRVLTKMQDRPPTYESNDTYRIRLKRDRDQGQHVALAFTIESGQNNGIFSPSDGDLAPPGYESDVSAVIFSIFFMSVNV